VTQGPGDKTGPAIDAQVVLYTTDASGTREVVQWNVGAGLDVVTSLADGLGSQDQPSLSHSTFAYRGTGAANAGIWVKDLNSRDLLRSPATATPGLRCRPGDPVDAPSVSDAVAAWTCGSAGSRTVVVAPLRRAPPVAEYELTGAGDVFGASVYGSLVAYVDASDGSVWIHDASGAPGQATRVCAGAATGVSITADSGPTLVAVARASTNADADIEVWDPSGYFGTVGRVAALLVPGEQRNPHLSGEWVAFEDLSTGLSRVVLWRWTTGLVFVPHASTSNQTLTDLSVVTQSAIRVVWADDGDGTGARHEIALYALPASVPDDGTPTPWPWACPDVAPRPPPATCDGSYPDDVDPCACDDDDDHDHDADHDHHDEGWWHQDGADDKTGTRHERHHDTCKWMSTASCTGERAHRTPVVLTRLALERDTCAPQLRSKVFDATPYPGDPYLPVLVCVDAERVSAGWLMLDGELIVGPGAFDPDVRHLERRRDVLRTGRISGAIAGRPGAELVARVIADPGSFPDATACTTGAVIAPPARPSGGGSGAGGSGTGTAAAVAGSGKVGGSGCGTPGGAGALGGLVLVAILRLRRRFAAARE
jgi:hypothetical protein